MMNTGRKRLVSFSSSLSSIPVFVAFLGIGRSSLILGFSSVSIYCTLSSPVMTLDIDIPIPTDSAWVFPDDERENNTMAFKFLQRAHAWKKSQAEKQMDVDVDPPVVQAVEEANDRMDEDDDDDDERSDKGGGKDERGKERRERDEESSSASEGE